MVGRVLDLAQRVAEDEHGASLVRELANVAAQPSNALRVETVRRLVQDEHSWVAEHRRREAETLPHPEGELADPSPRVLREPGGREDAYGRLLGQPRRGCERVQVVERGPTGVVAGRLEDGTDVADRVRQLVVPPAAEGGGATGWRDEPEQHPQGGRLTGRWARGTPSPAPP